MSATKNWLKKYKREPKKEASGLSEERQRSLLIKAQLANYSLKGSAKAKKGLTRAKKEKMEKKIIRAHEKVLSALDEINWLLFI